jgi:uncharacterized protein (TIGR03067 family)
MRQLLLLLAVLTAAFAPAPLPRRERQGKEVPDICGVWENERVRIAITPTHYKALTRPGYEYDVRIDPSANPKTIDMTGIAGTKADGWKWKGIYKVEGDTLTQCYRRAEYGRPAAFADRSKETITAVYKRVR